MPGCRDIVKDNFNGKLVKIKDPRDLFSKIVELTQSREKLESYSRNSKRYVKNFDLDLIVDRYDKIYKQVFKDKTYYPS